MLNEEWANYGKTNLSSVKMSEEMETKTSMSQLQEKVIDYWCPQC